MLNKKGQEEAPFELLIAVITMGFVMLIGVVAMNQLAEQKCINSAEAKLEEMKTKLEIVVNQKSPQKIDFSSECYNASDEIIKVQIYNSPAICADYCASGQSLCSLLEYANSKSGVYFKKCLNINPDAVFTPQTSPNPLKCSDRLTSDNMRLVNFNDEIGILRGVYELLNKTSATDSFPTVCAYCRQGTGNCSG